MRAALAVGEQWYNLRPDALAEYRIGQQHLRFWLEWDCGTMNVRDLAIKFTSYGHYLASREWAREDALLWLQGIPQSFQVSKQGDTHRQCLFDAMLGKRCM